MAVSSVQKKMPEAPAADTAAFRFVLGNDRAKRFLMSALRNKEVSHAYIFEGAAGFGKHNLAEDTYDSLDQNRISFFCLIIM